MKKLFFLLLAGWLCASPVWLCGVPEETKDKPVAAPSEKGEPSPSRHRKTGRAFLENGFFITLSSVDYWRKYSHWVEDWQFKLNWKDQRRKFFTRESPNMDSNSFVTNWTHTPAGAIYYNFARANGLNSRVSFLFSFGLSAFWESITEWREVISINDMTFTSFGGPAIGEPLFQLGSYFSRRRGFFNRLAATILNPVLAINNWLDRKSGPVFNSGPDAGWHRFSLFAGYKSGKVSPAGTSAVAQSGSRYNQFNLGLEMETNSVPGYGQAQTFHRFLSDTLSSRLFVNFNFSAAGLEEFQVRTSAVLFGYGWQSLREGADGSLRGSSGSLGYGCVFDLFKKRAVAWYDSDDATETGGPAVGDARFPRPTPTRFTDKLATISLLGPVLQLSWFGPRLHVRWTAEAYGDFAMVNALAYNRYSENHDTGGVKTTLLSWGYYYALGMTLGTELALEWRPWRLLAGIRYQFCDSIQGWDRFQYQGVVTNDFRIYDSRLVWRFSLGYRLPRTPLELALTGEGNGRFGRILDIREHYQENRIYYQLRLLF